MSASAGFDTTKGNYQAVTHQTNLNGDGKLTVNVAGNTHLKAASMVGKLGTEITTGTLTTEDLENKASYQSMGLGVNYSSQNSNGKDGSFSPTIAMPQDKSKHSTTQASIGENATLTITNQAAQTQDVSAISRDTKTSGFSMTEINTEVIGLRENLSKEASQAGFNAVGDLAMKQGWEDGSVEKTIAHAAMGAVVAGLGNGDALGGALGAGAAEAVRPATADSSTGKQETMSALAGALAGGGTGASTGLDGEKFNRQLHQKEIEWIDDHAQAFADASGGEITVDEAKTRLAEQALRGVDKGWSLKLGDKDDASAKAFLEKNDAQIFVTKDKNEFNDGTITRYGDTTTKVKALSTKEKENLNTFYRDNVKNVSDEPLSTLYAKDVQKRLGKTADELVELAKNSPELLAKAMDDAGVYYDNNTIGQIAKDGKKALGNMWESTKEFASDVKKSAVSLTENTTDNETSNLMNTLYDDDTASTTQGLIAAEKVGEGILSLSGVGAVGKAGVKGIIKSIDNAVDDALDIELKRPAGQGEGGNAAITDDVKQQLASGESFTVSAEEFKESLSKSKHTEMLTDYTVDQLKDMKLVKLPDTDIGYALKDFKAPDGTVYKDGELVAVHNNEPNVKGIGNDLMEHSIGQGAMALDHFDTGVLSNLYSNHGFKEYKRLSYDPQYDLDGSFKNKYGEVDVVYRKRDTEQASTNSKPPLEVGKVEIFKESKKTTGDGTVDRDHNPPKQALKARAEELKGKPLSKKEERRIEENSDTITLPKEVHQKASSSKGYKGDKPKEDAKDLQSATKKYSDEHIENSKNTEHAECIGVGCNQMNQKTNQEYDEFLENQFDENN